MIPSEIWTHSFVFHSICGGVYTNEYIKLQLYIVNTSHFCSYFFFGVGLIHVQHSESSYKFVKHWKDKKKFMFPVFELPNIELIFPERNKIENAPTAFKIDQTPSAKMKKNLHACTGFLFGSLFIYFEVFCKNKT